MTINTLYEQLGAKRDDCVEMLKSAHTVTERAYYDGAATAYDTVRGWVFQMIGEEGVETFKEALRTEAYNRLVKPKKKKAVPTGDVIPWSVKRKIMESEEIDDV